MNGWGSSHCLEAAVDLKCVTGDCNRVFARLAETLGDRDRDRGLADRRGAEEREDLHFRAGVSAGTDYWARPEVAGGPTTRRRLG